MKAAPEKMIDRAVALFRGGRRTDAEKMCRDLVKSYPKRADVHMTLAYLLQELGRGEESLEYFRQAAEIKPSNAGILFQYGQVLYSAEKYPAAEMAFRETLAVQPKHREALNNLGAALKSQGKLKKAADAFREALEISPDYEGAEINLASTYIGLRRLEESIALSEITLKRDPDNADANNNMGAALVEMERADEAIPYLEKALKARPRDDNMLHNLGFAYSVAGDMDEAKKYFRAALDINPTRADSWHDLMHITRLQNDDPAWQQLRKLETEVRGLPPIQSSRIYFTLGKVYNDQKQYGKAFDYYRRGNDLKHQIAQPDVPAELKRLDDVIDIFSTEFFERHNGNGVDSELPIFIVGMPRSGSTLVETIISSHPQVAPGGELRTLPELSGNVDAKETAFLDTVRNADAETWPGIARQYLNKIDLLADGADRLTDKQLANFSLVGLIQLTMPNARIIHCMRHPLDCCTSIYFTDFIYGHWYSTKLMDIGRIYLAYQKVMDHWRKVLPGRMLDLQYENVVDDLETSARKIIDWCGLPWDDACLNFQDTQRDVRTASVAQVRQKIYTSSVGRWQRYAMQLTPLRKMFQLDDNGNPLTQETA